MKTICQLCLNGFRWSTTSYFFSPVITFWIRTTPNAKMPDYSVVLSEAGPKRGYLVLGVFKNAVLITSCVVVDLIRPLSLCRRVFVFLYSNNRKKNQNAGGSREIKALSEEPFHIFLSEHDDSPTN